MGEMRSSGSIRRWAQGVRVRLERARPGRASTPAPPPRLDTKLEPLEPRILLSADVGLVPDEGLTLIALSPELVAPQVEIHDEVLARESAEPDPEAAANDEGLAEAEAGEAAAEVQPTSGDEAATSDGESGTADVEQGDPGRADQALAARVWGETGTADVEHREEIEATQLVVIDGRVPEVESLLASLLESTADLDAEAEAAPADESEDPASATLEIDEETDTTTTGSSAEATADALERRGIQVIVLDEARDGFDQVGEILEAFQGVTALHLVSHGSAGSLQLGKGRVTSETLQQRVRALRGWGHSLASEADILLYGCHVADGEVGIEFVSSLAAATGADVAASNDATGGDGYGDWHLEVATGAIEATAIDSAAFASALVALPPVTGTSGADDITISFDTGTNEWSVTGTGSTVTPFDSPTHVPVTDEGVITIDGAGGADTITLESVDPGFAGTIRILGGGAGDTITIESLAAGFAGTIEVDGGAIGDTITVAAVEAGFAGTVKLSGGSHGDEIVLGTTAESLSGTFELDGGAGDDTYRIVADEWGTARIDEAADSGTDTLSFEGRATDDFSGTSTLEYVGDSQSHVEQLAGLTLDVSALESGLADLVDWAAAISATDDLATQLAGLSGTADIGVGTAMDLADVFEQLRVYVDSLDPSLSASEVYDALAAFVADDVAYLGSAVIGTAISPTVETDDAFVFTLTLDDVEVTIGGDTDEDRINGADSLSALATRINEKLATSDVSGQVRAVATGPTGARRLAFVVDDATSKSLSVLGGSADAAGVGFSEATALTQSDLDDRLKGLGKLDVSLSNLAIDFDLTVAVPTVGIRFDLDASRTSDFKIDLGEAAEKIKLDFSAADPLQLESKFEAAVELRLSGDLDGSATAPDFGIELDDVTLSAKVTNGGGEGATSNIFEDGDAVDGAIGFLGARVDQADATGPISKLDMQRVLQKTDAAWLDLTQAQLTAETADAAGQLASRVAALVGATPAEIDSVSTNVFDLRWAIGIAPFLGLTEDSDPLGIEVITATGAADTGRSAVGESDLQVLSDKYENFAKLDPTKYVSLIGQVRGGLEALRQSDIFQSVDIPFIQGTVGQVADFADAFGDALLFDDGDDGIDSQNDAVLVTKLNARLAELKLDRVVRFSVDISESGTELRLEGVGSTFESWELTNAQELGFSDDGSYTSTDAIQPITLEAIQAGGYDFSLKVVQKGDIDDRTVSFTSAGGLGALVTKLNASIAASGLTGLVSFGVDASGQHLVLTRTSADVGALAINDAKELGFGAAATGDASITATERADLAKLLDKGFDFGITTTPAAGGGVTERLDEDGGDYADSAYALESLGNDVAKLLDESNEATFKNAQELTERLFEMIFPDEDPDDYRPFQWKGQKLTFDLEFDADLVDLTLPVAFDLDLGPIGNVGVDDDSTITIGGDVTFDLTLGLNLGDVPGQEIEAGAVDPTLLTELSGIDEITDVIKLTPSITAEGEPGEAINDDDDTPAGLTLEETKLVAADGVTITFGRAQNHDIVAESLINQVINVTSPDGFDIEIDRDRDGTFEVAAGATVPIRNVPAFEAFTEDGKSGYRLSEEFSFDVKIRDGMGAAPFTVTVPISSYFVNTTGAAKQKLLRDVEKAIAAAQGQQFDATIERSDTATGGSWRADGFRAGDAIRIANSDGNDGLYRIDSVTARTITLADDLATHSEVTTASGEGAVEIVGPGRIRFHDPDEGTFGGVDGFELGERIILSGTEANDGVYLISRIIDGPGGANAEDDVLVIDGFFDLEDEDGNPTETADNESVRVVSNGAPVRVDAETVVEDAEFELQLMIGDTLTTVQVVVSRDGEAIPEEGGEREPGAVSDLSNNQSLADLVADVQNAIDDAIEKKIEELGFDPVLTPAPEVEVRLDGTRLVLDLASATRVTGDPTLEVRYEDGFVKVTRDDATTFGLLGDGFRIGQRVLVHGTAPNDGSGSSAFDGEYTVVLVTPGELALTPVGFIPEEGLTPDGAGIVVTETFSMLGANGLTNQLLGFGSSPGADLDATLDDLVIFASDGQSRSIVLDGVTDVHELFTRINGVLSDTGDIATIGLNEEKIGFDLTQDAAIVDASGETFRVETINGSYASLRLGILGADAKSDVNEDGQIDQLDGDGVIEGAPVGGASLFDRFFLESPTISLGLDVEAPEGIDVTGDFGFFEVGATANGDITAVAAFEIQDPIDTTHGITINDLYEAFRDFDLLKTMVDPFEALSFGGATLDDDAGEIVFTNDGDEGRITRSDGESWKEDGFKKDQKIRVTDNAGDAHLFQILNIVEGVGVSILELDARIDEAKDGDAGEGIGKVTVESAVATLTLKDLSLPGGLAEFAGLADARVVVALMDLGNPFFDEVRSIEGGGEIGAFTALNRILLDGALDELEGVEEGDTIEIEWAAAGGAMATAIVSSVNDANKREITLKENVEGITAGQRIEKITITRPPEILVDTPDFGDLLDLSNIGFEQILDGLLALSAFLDQFEAFEFLNEDMPLIGVSVNDLLGYADQFRDMVNEFKADPAGNFQQLETRLEDLLGIDDGVPIAGDPTTDGLDPFDIELEFVTEARGEAGESDDHQIAKLTFVVGASFRESLGVEFDVGEAGVLAGAADLEAFGGIGFTLAVGIDLSRTRVHATEGTTVTLAHTGAAGGDTIARGDGGSFVADGFMTGQTIEIEAAGDFLAGDYEIESVTDGLITLRDEFALKDGVDAGQDASQALDAEELEGERGISIYDETGISAQLTGQAEDLSFRAAVGPIGVFIQEDDPDVTAIYIGGSIGAGAEKSIFDAGLEFGDAGVVERKLITELSLDDFNLDFGATIDAVLPVAFPTDSLDQGRVEFHAGLTAGRADSDGDGRLDTFEFNAAPPTLTAYDAESPDVALDSLGDLFDLEGLLDLGKLSIFDNVLLAVDGIDFFLGGLQDILDGEVFGVELPLIGDSLSEGAGFIEDLREGFLADFREGVEEAEDFVTDLDDPDKNFISKLLFDVLSDTGLLLVEVDGEMVKATKAGLQAGLFNLSDAVSATGVPDLTGSVNALTDWVKDPESQVKWNMTLGQNLLDVDTDLDIDLGVPGLGFEAEGPLGLKIGWDLDLGFGLNFKEGFFLDIAPEDGTDLEVNLDVTLPDRLAGQLAFLQLDAINDGSGLGATFVVDIYNKMDLEDGAEIDERLSFSELSKVRLRAEVEAQALASFDMVLALNSDLIPSAPSVFPTVGADFVLDWSIGGHIDDAGEVSLDGDQLKRTKGTWAGDGFVEGQRIIIQGFENDDANGQHFIASVVGDTITLKSSSGVTGVKQTAGLEIDSLQDLSLITGSMIMEGLNEVAFNNIELDLGSFISDLIAPILSEIQEVTRPLQPIVDLATSPLPVVSDFAGPTSLIDLAGVFGTVRPEFLKAVADIITLANAIPTEKGEVKIGFGDFKIFDRATSDPDMDLTDPNFDRSTIEKPKPDSDTFDKALDEKDTTGSNKAANNKNRSFAQKLKNLEGFQFPFLSNPTELFGLFTGEPVTLVGYDMPALDFEFQYTQFIPLYPPLGLGIGGSFGAHIDFAFGFDTEGINQFADTGFRNPLLIFNGLYVSDNPTDVTGAGPDLPELTFTGSFTITAELNVLFARAGAGGGLFAEIMFDLFDPDHDGRVRILEIAESFETEFKFGSPLLAPLAIFDVSGNVKARLFAFLEINLLFATISKEWDLVPPITLVDFDIEFERKPKLAAELPDGVLQLNMGSQSGQRLNGDLRDISEHFEVRDDPNDSRKIQVRAFGLGNVAAQWQSYDNPTAIIALGGAGNDVIDLSRLTRSGIRFELEGGEGNDVILAGTGNGGGLLKGGVGDDVIVGSGGADIIYGGEGHDVIDGGAGNDILFADGGRIVEGEARVTSEDLEIESTRSEIHRADNALWLADGFKAGQTVLISGSTLAPEGSDPEDGEGNNGYFKVATGWSGGALKLVDLETGANAAFDPESTDELKIEIVNTEYRRSIQASTRASDGDDLLLGGAGNDSVFGGGGADLILGGGATLSTGTANDGLRGTVVAAVGTNGTNGRVSKELRRGFSASSVAMSDAAGDTHDILIGDAGEIRFRLGQAGPTFRDVIETNRGIFFDADEIHGNGGFDRIFGGQGNDVVHGGDGDDLIFGESGLDELHGDDHADEIHGGRDVDLILGGDHDDFIYGDEGNDILGGDDGIDHIYGQAGSDRIWGGLGNDRLFGGGAFDTIYGGTGQDRIDGGAGDDTIYGDDVDTVPGGLFDPEGDADAAIGGVTAVDDAQTLYNDIIFVGGGNDRVDGQQGSDEYIVDIRGADNDAIVSAKDTGIDGIDRLTVNGTDFADLFLLRRIEYDDPGSVDDPFDGFVASINRDGGVERIDYSGMTRIVVNGQQGNDEFAVDDIGGVTELNGGGGEDLFKVGQLYKTRRTVADANLAIGDSFETVETTRGFLSSGISEAMTINAGADNDEIVVLRNLAVLQVNGEEGDDKVTVRAFALTQAEIELQKTYSEEKLKSLEREDTEIEGGAGADLIQYAVNAPVNIDGGDGLDTVAVIGTEFDDDFVITDQGVYGAGLNVNLVNVELLSVDGAEGDDAFFVQSTQDGLITQILGGLGSDTIDVTGDAPPVISNDLLGHSGIITHGIESNDPLYQGADGDGIAVHGISANVADDDEPFARISLTDGSTRIGEGVHGFTDNYFIALTREPEEDEIVYIDVLVPSLTPEERARGAQKFTLSTPTIDLPKPDPLNPLETDSRVTAIAADGSFTVWFDASNWSEQLEIEILAVPDETPDGQAVGALEGESFGVINHKVTSSLGGASLYDGLALPSVSVQVEDSDEADVLVFESDEFTRVYEADGSSYDTYQVRLSREPVAGVVEVHVDVTPPPGVVDQISLGAETGAVDQSTLVLTFTKDNWHELQTVRVDGVPEGVDGAREGFHRDFIQHSVVAVADTDQTPTTTDVFVPGQERAPGEPLWPTTSVLLEQAPVQEVGVIGSVSEDGLTITLAFGTLVADSLEGHVIRLSSGPADGQARYIESNDETTITLSAAFEVAPDADLGDSDFRTSDVTVTVDPHSMGDGSEIMLGEDGGIARRAPSGVAGDHSWKVDGFEENQIIIVENESGELLGRYVIKSVGVGLLQTERVVGDGGLQDPNADSAWIENARVYVAPLDIDRFLVNSSTLVFLDDEGRPQTRESSHVTAEYEYLVEGFDGRFEERIVAEVIDADTAGVIVTQTGFSTNVTEGGWVDNGAAPPTITPASDGSYTTVDTYTVRLTKQPVFDGGDDPFVRVTVTPEITRTSSGSFAYELKQLVVAAGEPGDAAFSDSIVLEFDANDWDVPQTVTVAARQDGVVDGNDTQVFPEIPHTVANIQGPLFVDGRGGQGSLEGLTRPVMLEGETSQRPEDGRVASIDADGLVVSRAAVEAELTGRGLALDALDDFIGRTIELIDITGLGSGPGDGDFTLIVGVTAVGDDAFRFELDPVWDLSDAELAEIESRSADNDGRDERYGFAFTDESPNFFVDETTQVDVMRVNDEDNASDFRVGYPNGFGELTAFVADDYADTAGLLVPGGDADDFGQGQWGRITGLGMSPDSYIARAWRPGGITYGHLEGLEINLGLGNNHFTVDAVHQRNDGVRTYTVINASDGDDVIDVSVAAPENPEAGLPFLRIDAGDGDDTVNASPDGMAATTLPIEIHGGYGSDALTGGDGDDLMYGDFGTSAITNVVDLDEELALRQAAKSAPPDAPIEVPQRVPAAVVPTVETTRPGEGSGDVLRGMGGDDRMFGGARADLLLGGAGKDILFGDYGRVRDLPGDRRTIESIDLFQGGADVIVTGAGNDIAIGGFGRDGIVGDNGRDLLVGDFIQVTLRGDRIVSVQRTAGGGQDIAATSAFELYAPKPAPGGPDGRAPELDRPSDDAPAPRAEVDVSASGERAPDAGSSSLRGRHRVESGDSLWTISERELGDPFRWPEVAEANRQLIDDPNVIEPTWVLRMPSAVSDEDAELTDAAAARANIAHIDERIDAQPRDWGFSAAGDDTTLPQVGEGPPDAQPTTEGAPTDEELPDQGANDAGEPAELLSAVWAGLTGWQTRLVQRRRRERRWLAFDAQSGGFSRTQLDTDRAARDTSI